VTFRDARVRTNNTSAAGSVEIAHDGGPEEVIGSQTTLSPLQAFPSIQFSGDGNSCRRIFNGAPEGAYAIIEQCC